MNYNEKFKKICEEARLVGASNVIVRNDEIVNTVNYGYKSLSSKEEVTTDTIFRIASISKTVAAIGLMQLVEQKKINLDDDISKYFGFKIRNPKYPDDVITVKMITTQTSSITDGYDDEGDLPANTSVTMGYNGVNGTSYDASLEDLLIPSDSIFYTPLTYSDYRPGERFIYSNFGCGLMACLIEIASKEYFTDYMINHVFKPLNIDASYMPYDIQRKDLIADMYYPKDGSYEVSRTAESFYKKPYKRYPLGQNYRGPAGGLFISMNDLSTIMRMFLNKGTVNNVKLLEKETVEYMYQMQWFGNGDDGGYRSKGIQMKVLDVFEYPFRGHTGGAYGVRSYMYFDMKNQVGGCFITNGGYYEKKSYSVMIDIFHLTIKNMITEFYPKTKESTLKINLNSNVLEVDNRHIIMSEKMFYKDNELFIPAISLSDGLGIVALYDENKNTVTFRKNNKEITFINLERVNNVQMVSLDKVLTGLNLPKDQINNIIYIKY